MATSRLMRSVARKRLDERLSAFRLLPESTWVRPHGGWVRAIREALGMPRHVLGHRMGVGAKRVQQLEQGESRGSINMESLARAAAALDCELIVALVPREPLETRVTRRRSQLTREWIHTRVLHSMSLEGQAVSYSDLPTEVVRNVERMFPDERLWDDF